MIPKIIVTAWEGLHEAMTIAAWSVIEEAGVKDKVLLAFPSADRITVCPSRQGTSSIELPFAALYDADARAQAIKIIRGAV